MKDNWECRRFQHRIDAYLDGELSPAEREEMCSHGKACPECGQLLEDYEKMTALLRDADKDMEIPEEAAKAWRSAIRAEARQQSSHRRKAPNWKWVKSAGAIAAALLVVIGLTNALQNSDFSETMRSYSKTTKPTSLYGNSDVDFYSEAAVYDEGNAWSAEATGSFTAAKGAAILESDGAEVPGNQTVSARKPVILRNASRSIQTTLFDEDIEKLDQLIASRDAWAENRSISGQSYASGGTGRSFSADIRVPSEQLDAFLVELDAIGAVYHSSETAEDISSRYYDAQTRLSSLRAQHDRLTDLIAEATDLDDLITLEDKLYEVQYSIDSIEGQIRGWDSLANYSTVHISINEVLEYQEPVVVEKTLGQRIAEGFRDSVEWLGNVLQSALIGLIAFLPWLAVLAIAVALAVLVVRIVKKRRR